MNSPSSPSPPPPGSPGPWGGGPRPRLVRRRDNKVIAGVCSGVAHYFGVDPVLIRIGAVILAFTGWGVLAYLVAWCVLPQQYSDGTVVPASRNPGYPWLPIVLVVCLALAVPAGFGFLFGGWGWGGLPPVPFLLLIGAGYLVWRAKRGGGHFRHHGHPHGGGWVAPTPPRPTQPTGPAGWGDQWVDDPTVPAPSSAPSDDRPLWARYDDEDDQNQD
ncbi:MAG: PspC domain-containing protein, partial [Acidimicrobiales bacterium]